MIEKTLKRLTEALNEAEDAEFEMLKQEVSNLTDENEHTQAVLVIADYYNLTYYVQKFKEIKDYQDSPQYQGCVSLFKNKVKTFLNKCCLKEYENVYEK